MAADCTQLFTQSQGQGCSQDEPIGNRGKGRRVNLAVWTAAFTYDHDPEIGVAAPAELDRLLIQWLKALDRENCRFLS